MHTIRLLRRINNRDVLTIAIALYILLFSAISFWRYYNFSYNAMDLAIINQAFYNSAHGHWFVSSIHPPTYLADHLELGILLLLPFYTLYQNPLTLLLLQTIALGLCAVPIYRLASAALNQRWALWLALAWLVNPLVHNINLFEFHLLPFAIFPLLWACYYFQQKKFWPFLAWSGLALLVREDVALVVIMFAFLALLECRPRRWWLTPLLGGVGYFIAALKIINQLSDLGHYKFFIYYSWLGDSWSAIIGNALTHPALILGHLATFGNFEFALGLLMALIFLPLFAPAYLLLGLLVFAQFALGSFGGSGALLQLHYPALLLPALFISAIYGLKKITTAQPQTASRAIRLIKKEPQLSLLILLAGVIYTSLALGPLVGVGAKLLSDGFRWPGSNAASELVRAIPSDASVAASYKFLAPLSSREHLASFNYLFLGKQQFLSRDYALPPDTEYLLIDYDDLIIYQLQYSQSNFYKSQYQQALTSWPKLLDGFGLLQVRDTMALYQKNQPNRLRLVEVWNQPPPITQPTNTTITPAISFLGVNQLPTNGYALFWQAREQPASRYQLLLSAKRDGVVAYEKIYPLAYDVLPTNQWLAGTIIQTNYWFGLKDHLPNGDYELTIQVIEIKKGGLEVDAIRSTKNVIDTFDRIGPPIPLGVTSF